MKAQILKIAGVKTEAEFYKKYPTEEAFMKKHGKELEKAQYGAYVAGQKEQPEQQKPIMYDDLQQDTMARITGISKEEKARQEGLAALKASKSSGGGDGLAGLLGMAGQMLAPQMDKLMGVEGAGDAVGGEADIASSIAGALGKNGKKLKKAQVGDVVPADAMDYMSQMPSDYQSSNLDNIGKDAFGGVKSFDFAKGDPRVNPSAAVNTGFDYKGAFKKMPGALGSQLGTLIGSFQQLEQNKKDIKKANQWADISQIGAQAALSRPEQSKRRYARPEDNLVTGMNPLGKKDSLLAAQNGAEIQNTYNPGDLYSDLGYEPLNDSNPKQYARGGNLRKAQSGITANSFAGIGGDIGGILGSKIGGGSGQGGPGSKIGSTIGGVLGMAIPIPGVGSLIGSTLGGLAGGLFDAEDQNKLQEAQDRQTNAINQATIGKGVNNLQQANKAFMENGGYMNPEYNPQVIAKFGDYDVDQLFAPPHDADMLRAGGHLKEYTPPSARAMYTGRDLPYQMEDGGQMAMGGDLQVHRGEAETLSYNPFLPDGGETIMFRGPSHDNGGMPISYGENGVEVEGGEPAIKLQDGGSPDGNLVVYGNMVIPNYGVEELGDPKAKGKKFKHYVADLSKTEAKQNKLIQKATQLINDANVNDQFDKLSLNTGQANLIGTTMTLKNIAEKKKTAAAVQNAILDTASEMGLESDALAKGKIKYAKANDPYAEFGAKLKPGGKASKKAIAPKYDPEFENFINPAMMLEQDNSSLEQGKDTRGGVYRGGAYNYGTGEADKGIHDTPEKAKAFYYKNYWPMVKDLPAGLRTRALQMAINTGDPYGELLVAGKQMTVDERKKAIKDVDKLGVTGVDRNKAIHSARFKENKDKIQKVVEEYKKDPQAFLDNLDAEQNRYYDSIVKHNDFGADPTTVREFFDDYVGLAKHASQKYIPTKQAAAASTTAAKATPAATSAPVAITPATAQKVTQQQSVPGEFIPGISKLPKDAQPRFDIRNFLPKGAVPAKMDPIEVPYAPTYSEWDPESGNYQLANVNVNAKRLKPEQVAAAAPAAPVSTTSTGEAKEKSQFPWDQIMTGVNSVLPFIRPSNQIPLDPSQLSGELYALSQNQEEPVFAQSYQPLLTQASSVSLQDQLNEITSQSRAAERMAQGNPAALAMIASQAAEAKNKVLGEQFRMNQGEAQRVSETNRQTMNEAMKTNLGLYDQQQQRAAQAKSNTKMQNIAALNSINDKIAKNKLENRQMAISENLYNYRFTPNGVAYNMNPLQNFNMYGAGTSGKGSGELEEGKDFSYNKAGKIIGIHSTKDDGSGKRNGAIVKAIKGL